MTTLSKKAAASGQTATQQRVSRKGTAKKIQRKRRTSREVFYESLGAKLSQKHSEILDLFRRDQGVGQDASHEGDDNVDRATFHSNRELALSLSNGEREVLAQINEALDRLEQGEYGCCSNCTEAIHDERLMAIPWARHCVVCQELEEKGLLEE